MTASVLGVILDWFWLAMLVATAYNAWHWQIMGGLIQGPGTHATYVSYAWDYLLWAGIPWAVMGAGILSGDARNLIDFLRPADGQWSVIAFYASRFGLDIGLAHWLYQRDGFRKVAEHPGLFRPANILNQPALLEAFYWAWMGLFVTVTAVLVIFDPVPAGWGDAG